MKVVKCFKHGGRKESFYLLGFFVSWVFRSADSLEEQC